MRFQSNPYQASDHGWCEIAPTGVCQYAVSLRELTEIFIAMPHAQQGEGITYHEYSMLNQVNET